MAGPKIKLPLDEEMKRPFKISCLVHVIVVLLLVFGLPYITPPDLLAPKIIPVDVVDISELTNAGKKKPKPVEKKQEEPKPQKEQPKPTPKVEEKVEEKKPEVKPEPPKPEPKKPEPIKPPEPKKEEKPKEPEKKPEKKQDKKPEPKKEDKKDDKKKKKQEEDPLASILKNVEKLEKKSDPTEETKKDAPDTPQEPENKALSDHTDKLSITEEDLVRRQIEGCWNVPAGAKDIENMIVDIRVEMNQDRTVKKAEIVDKVRLMHDPFFRTAAESARRAVLNPKCSPLQLPPDQYNKWKVFIFSFNPKEMIGL